MSYFNVLICMAGNTSKTRDDMQVEKWHCMSSTCWGAYYAVSSRMSSKTNIFKKNNILASVQHLYMNYPMCIEKKGVNKETRIQWKKSEHLIPPKQTWRVLSLGFAKCKKKVSTYLPNTLQQLKDFEFLSIKISHNTELLYCTHIITLWIPMFFSTIWLVSFCLIFPCYLCCLW